MAILEWQFEGVPWAVLDIETTGLVPGFDRIIEISVVHIEPHDEEPRLIFDTLINPRRTFEGDIHGIDEEDVARAPLFGEVAQKLACSLVGRVIAAHNAHFDMTFLAHEFNEIGLQLMVPFACTMDLVEVLGLGRRASLHELGDILDISFRQHVACEDAIATAHLLTLLRRTIQEKKIRSFAELMQRTRPTARYTGSWSYLPIANLSQLRAAPNPRPQLSRSKRPIKSAVSRIDYGAALIAALADFVLTDEEEVYLKGIQRKCHLKKEQIRATHSAALMWVMARFAADGWVDDHEAYAIHEIIGYLQRLGWAPGEF